MNFNSNLYSFSEGVGLSSGIAVMLSSPIAQTLIVTVFAGNNYNYIILSCFRGLCVCNINLPRGKILPKGDITSESEGLLLLCYRSMKLI